GSSSGATDGFAITGVMLEATDGQQVIPSAFEYLPGGVDLLRAQRFFWQISDPANTVNIPSSCNVTTPNTPLKSAPRLPTPRHTPVNAGVGRQPRRAGARSRAVPAASSFGARRRAGPAGPGTTLAPTAPSNRVNNIGFTCPPAGTIALGTGTNLIGATNTAAN